MNPAHVRTEFHAAILDPMSGTGVLVMPDENQDVIFESEPDERGWSQATSVHAEDLKDMTRKLAALDWEVLEAEDWENMDYRTGGQQCGELRGGRALVRLFGAEPISSAASTDLGAMAEADQVLRAEAEQVA